MTKYYLIALLMLLQTGMSEAKDKKKVVYKSHTEIDFTGEKVEGKVKAPAVFYIFQRKRAQGHQATAAPKELGFHDRPMKKIVEDSSR